jgi:hypothetical protein
MKRRDLLLSTGAIFAIAGCSGDSEERTTPTQTSSDTPTPTPTPTDTDTPTQTNTQTATEEVPSTETVNIGEIFGDNDLQAVVREFTTQQALEEYTEAERGNDFAIIRLVAKNTTTQYDLRIGGFDPTFSATLQDAEEYTYDQVFEDTDTPFVSQTLVPGEVMRGDLLFRVADNASGLILNFDFSDSSLFDLRQVTVDLTQRASTISDLTQDLKVDINSIGDSVGYEGLEVTINGVEFREDSNAQNAVVDVTFSNDTSGEIDQYHLQPLWCKDGQGRYLDKDIFGLANVSRAYSTDSPLSSGETRRGKVAFNVPRESEQVYCSFDFSEYVEGFEAFWQLR